MDEHMPAIFVSKLKALSQKGWRKGPVSLMAMAKSSSSTRTSRSTISILLLGLIMRSKTQEKDKEGKLRRKLLSLVRQLSTSESSH